MRFTSSQFIASRPDCSTSSSHVSPGYSGWSATSTIVGPTALEIVHCRATSDAAQADTPNNGKIDKSSSQSASSRTCPTIAGQMQTVVTPAASTQNSTAPKSRQLDSLDIGKR